MAQIQKGTTYSTGDQVTATNLNALADAAILLPGAITDQTAKTVPLAADTVLIHSAADTALRKSTLTQLFSNATGIPISTGISGLGTGIATALAVNTGSAGAPVLFNGALGTPSSGTVTNLTGTASININGTVGATTASTGAFTTLTSSFLAASGPLASFSVAQGLYGYYSAGGVIGAYSNNTGTLASLILNGSSIAIRPAGSTVGDFTTSGLAVTGALSATGAVTLNNNQYIQFKDTSGGVNSYIYANASDVFRLQHSAANKNIFITVNGASGAIQFGEQAGTVYGSFSSTGLAVTGAVTSTSDGNNFVLKPSSSGSVAYAQFVNSAGSEIGYIGYGTATTAGSTLRVVNELNGPVDILSNFALVGRFSSTGLAVTGALSATSASTIQNTFTVTRSISASRTWTMSLENGTADYITDAAGAYPHRFFVGATKYAQIDTAGLEVTGTGRFTGATMTLGTGFSVAGALDVGFDGNARNGISLTDSTNTSSASFATFRKTSGAAIGSIARVTTTDAVVYNTTSDARLKENFRDFTDSGRLIDSLKPRVFDWKNSDENGKNVVGFVAQEEHAADPIFAHIGAVSVGDEDPETITKQWQRSDSALIPILVAELKALRQRVAALENS